MIIKRLIKDKQAVAKQFWSYVKTRRRDATVATPLHNDGVLVPDTKGKTNTLNQQYVTVFSKVEGDISSKGVSPYPVTENLNISQAGVTNLLKGLNTNKASGPDKTSPKVLPVSNL